MRLEGAEAYLFVFLSQWIYIKAKIYRTQLLNPTYFKRCRARTIPLSFRCLRCTYFWINLQVVIQNINGDGEVSCVKWVAAIPTLRPELPPLTYTSVKIAQREHEGFKLLLVRTHLQSFLSGGRHSFGVIIKYTGIDKHVHKPLQYLVYCNE